MNNLTDKELIDYTIKFDTDPVRVRLAKVMDNMPGIILDELEYAGMDPELCTFENTYSPGQYITHLENEIEFQNSEILDLQEKLRKLEARTVLEYMSELRDLISSADIRAARAEAAQRVADDANRRTQDKMKVWRALSTDL